jgi:hypothetical protein
MTHSSQDDTAEYLQRFLRALDSSEMTALSHLLRAVQDKEDALHTYSKAYLNKKKLFFYLEKNLRSVSYENLILSLLGDRSSLQIKNTELPEEPPEYPGASSML